ncbi:serine/threonine protein kinase [Candidatus Falkowbacteria bacterium]|nr:serine/threonine protein kinase [Candidatus Falkowbacteria bacterium]
MTANEELDGAVKQIRELCAQSPYAQGKNFFDQSLSKRQGGQVGDRHFETLRRAYQVVCRVAEGDYSQLFGAYMADEAGEEERVVIKIVDDPADNDLLQNELRVLEYLQVHPGSQQKHLPVLVDRFVTGGQGGEDECHGSVLKYFDGLDILEVRNRPKFAKGMDPYHVGWVLQRTLSAAGFAHSCGVVHCNIEPAHIMIRPRNHGLCLVDWSYAAINPLQTGDRYRVFNEIGYSAPEIRDGAKPHPSADLYSIGKSMVALLGGNIATGEMPGAVDERFQKLIKLMILEDPLARAQDAWVMHQLLKPLRQEIWGEHEFTPLEV